MELDLDAARRETRSLYEDRGLSDADLTYLDEEISPDDYPERDLAALQEQGAVVEEPEGTEDVRTQAASYVWISAHSVWFSGGPGTRVYYKAANPWTRVCHPYPASAIWVQRQIYGRCGGGGYIWYVLVRR